MTYNENTKKNMNKQAYTVMRGSNANEVNILRHTPARQIVQYGIYKLLMLTLHTPTMITMYITQIFIKSVNFYLAFERSPSERITLN